jgi:predicted enzyme related to lactoylglutathione lyase
LRVADVGDGADGATFRIWQPGGNRGAQAVNRPGAMSWNELDTREPDAAKSFYGDVFGWSLETIEQDGTMVYGSWQHEGRKIGGLLPMGEEFPAHMPANWVAYFGVDDVEATAARAEELGGGVRVPKREVPAGAFSVLSDAHGAVFAVLQGEYDPPPG